MTEDEKLEREIAAAVLQFQTAKTVSIRRIAWEKFKALQAKRSPAQVEKMEKERGLR